MSEQLRILSDEKVILDSGNTYSSSVTHDWTSRDSCAFVLQDGPRLVIIRFTAEVESGVHGAARIRIIKSGDTDRFVATSGGLESGATSSKTVTTCIYLPAGSYTLQLQSACWLTGGNKVIVGNLKVGAFNVPDLTGGRYTDYNEAIPDNTEENVIDQDINIPSSRKTCLGGTKQYVLHIVAWGSHANRKNAFQAAAGSGDLTFRLEVDSAVQGTPADGSCTDYSTDTSNPTYGEGAFGRIALPFGAGDTVNVKLRAYNKTGAAVSCNSEFIYWITPWVPSYSTVPHEPVSLDFPQGSTMYAMMEPLFADPTKYMRLGAERALDLSADYYKTVSGTAILSFDYTFEIVKVLGCRFWVQGWGAIVSHIGVDVR